MNRKALNAQVGVIDMSQSPRIPEIINCSKFNVNLGLTGKVICVILFPVIKLYLTRLLSGSLVIV